MLHIRKMIGINHAAHYPDIQAISLRQYSWSGALLNMSAALVIIQITWTLPISEARECQQRQYLIPSHLETTASEVKDTLPL